MSAPRTRLSLPTVLGRLDVVGIDEACARAAFEPALAGLLAGGPSAEPIELDGRPAWLKASRLRGSAAWRYGLRHLLARRAPPRVRELENLAWLRARLFRAPEPLAAGFVARGARLRFQFLICARLPDAQPLDGVLDRAAPAERASLLDELAVECARLHALGFIHHDLFLRNLLVTPAHTGDGDPRRLVWVDAWRGGPGHWLRDAAYDLGCLMLEAAGLFTPDEEQRFFEHYFAERRAQQRPADRTALLAAAERERATQLARVRREPHRWRRDMPPQEEWKAPHTAEAARLPPRA